MLNSTCISVVIPTLGGPTLVDTLNCLVAERELIREIVICIPKDRIFSLEGFDGGLVKVIRTERSSQVAQRYYGLKIALGAYVLQIDDDISFEHGTLSKLLDELRSLGPRNAVSPVAYNIDTKSPFFISQRGFSALLQNFYHYMVCGLPWGNKKHGRLSRLMVAIGVDPSIGNLELIEADWLNGGMVLCRAEDQVIELFYPFEGKAYFEDYLHSSLRQAKGVKHWYVRNLKYFTKVHSSNRTLKEVRFILQRHWDVLRLCQVSFWKIIIFMGAEYMKQFAMYFIFRPVGTWWRNLLGSKFERY